MSDTLSGYDFSGIWKLPLVSDLSDRSALVLGGTRGLGLASAAALRDRGLSVAVCGRDAGRASDAAESLGDGVVGLVGDVSDPKELNRVVTSAEKELGRLSVLVANAGGPPPGGFFELDAASWRTGYERTLMSVVNAISYVVPPMSESRWGRIVVIGSSSVRKPISGLTLSNVFRPAIAGLVKDLSGPLASDGITINMVCPGRIDTDRVRMLDLRKAETEGVDVSDVQAASVAGIPMGRYGRPDEFAALVGFLASEQASYVTGQTILADGGMVPTLP